MKITQTEIFLEHDCYYTPHASAEAASIITVTVKDHIACFSAVGQGNNDIISLPNINETCNVAFNESLW